MIRSVLALVFVAAIAAAPASAKMVCHDTFSDGPNGTKFKNGESCGDQEALDRGWITLYCTHHPSDPDCMALGYHYASSDPIDQRVDQRFVDHFCATQPNSSRCMSPFTFWRRQGKYGPEWAPSERR
jgi:hypothetical protein